MLKTSMHCNFVVLSSGRSGSTFLTQLLNCHPKVFSRGELLNREELRKHKLLKGAQRRTLSNYILARLLPPKVKVSHTGFKLFNEQLEYSKLSLKELLRDLCSPLLIILYRVNLLEAYVSLKIAFQTDVWYSEQETNQCSIVIDWRDFQQYVQTEKRRWRNSISSTEGMKKMYISFEELTACHKEVMERVFTFLKIEKCTLGVSSVRQNPLPLAQKIKNYEEIMNKVETSGLSYTLCLEELKGSPL